ncbi:MAG TPA: TolC family protein [Candidatus Wallbacteria bacterium]|nr:TolC family protein [Candidatus Wallbacteria bacterium]
METGVAIEQRDALRKIEYIEKAYEIASKSLRQAYENFEFSRLSFQKGLISNIDLRDAQDKLTSAKRSVVSLIIQHKLACHKFYFAMGRDL